MSNDTNCLTGLVKVEAHKAKEAASRVVYEILAERKRAEIDAAGYKKGQIEAARAKWASSFWFGTRLKALKTDDEIWDQITNGEEWFNDVYRAYYIGYRRVSLYGRDNQLKLCQDVIRAADVARKSDSPKIPMLLLSLETIRQIGL